MKLKQITPSDYPGLKRFFERQRHRLCVYSLPSIIVWSNQAYQPYGAVSGDTLVIAAEFTTRKEHRHLILPVSPVRDHSPEELRDLAVKLDFETYWFVPEQYLKQYGRPRIDSFFKVKEQKEYKDYIYLAEDLAELKGNKYSKKRNLIHQFEKWYLDKDLVRIERITPSVLPECVEFLEKWCREHNCDMDKDEDLACEKQAILNAIEHIDILDVKGILLRVGGTVSALGIASRLTADTGVLHFEKALTSIKGLYQFFDNECAKRLFKGYKYINKESDMNLPALAKAKKSYHPVTMVKSYQLTLR